MFEILREQNVPEEWINTVWLILQRMNVSNETFNKGVLQGSVIACDIFRRFLDPLIKILSRHSISVYAYADDIALLIENHDRTKLIIQEIEKWSKETGLNLNRKKCGIMNLTNNPNLTKFESEN